MTTTITNNNNDITNTTWDAIIIGSGWSGLSCASLLSLLHQRVLVLERHNDLGGSLQEWTVKGLKFAVGVQYVGGQIWHDDQHPTLLSALCRLATRDKVKWRRIDEVVDVLYVNGRKFEMHSSFKRQLESLSAAFPNHKKQLKRYFDEVKRSDSDLKKLAKYQLRKVYAPTLASFTTPTHLGKETIEQALQRLGLADDEVLVQVLTYQGGIIGGSPSEISFLTHAAAVVYYMGASFPEGGPTTLIKACVEAIEEAGGKCLANTAVESVEVDKSDRAIGVKIKGNLIKGKSIISCVGASTTFNRLLAHVPSSKFPLIRQARKALEERHVALTFSMGSILLQLDGSSKELNLPSGNVWINVDKDMNDLTPIFISFLSAKDPVRWDATCPPNKSSAQVAFKLTYAKFKEWEHVDNPNSDPKYLQVKQEYMNQVMQRVYEVMPQLQGRVDWMEFTSPLDVKRSIHSADGAIYGLRCDPARYQANLTWLSTNVGVKNFHLGGEDIFVPGIGGALVGACLAACCVNKKAFWKYSKVLKLPGRVGEE